MKRIKRTPAEKARAQYTGYLVKEPMELMDFLAAKMPDASRTKLKSLLSKRIVLVDNVITTQFNFPLQPGMKVLISKDKNKKEFRHPLLKIVYEDAYIIVVEKKEGLLSVGTERQKERTAQHILSEYVGRSGRGNRIYVVHRLDRDTSGLMMFAKDEKTQYTLRVGSFKFHSFTCYWVIETEFESMQGKTVKRIDFASVAFVAQNGVS